MKAIYINNMIYPFLDTYSYQAYFDDNHGEYLIVLRLEDVKTGRDSRLVIRPIFFNKLDIKDPDTFFKFSDDFRELLILRIMKKITSDEDFKVLDIDFIAGVLDGEMQVRIDKYFGLD